MKRYMAALAALLLAGCGSSVVGSTSTSASSRPQASSTPSAHSATATFDLLPPPAGPPAVDLQISCNRPIGSSDPVAIVQLHDGSTVLRDYVDVAHPVTACVFGVPQLLNQLIDAQHVVVFSGQGKALYAVVDLPQVKPHWFQLPPQTEAPSLLAVGSTLDAVAWMSADLASNTDQIHITTRAGDHVVASLPNPHGGRCGSSGDSKTAGYTRSGKDLFVLDQPIPTLNSLLAVQGERALLRLAPDSGPWPAGAQPAMAVWSPTTETLYYRKGGDVWSWTPAGGSKMFLPGVSWYYPTISPDGRHLAFAELESNGLHTVSMVDLPPTSRPIHVGNGNRTLPVFLNSTQLWFKSESQGPCGPGGNQPLVFDLTDNSESASIIDMPVAVWPATSSNF